MNNKLSICLSFTLYHKNAMLQNMYGFLINKAADIR